MAKGFSQREGINFFDIYAPVCRITTIRVLIVWAAIKRFVIHQMDVKTTFLNGDLTEEIYMEKPEGLNAPAGKLYKLIKSLYGLKQAPKLWHEKFDGVVHNNGYQVSESDKCLYIKVPEGKVVIICLYVDDMLILGSDLEIVTSTKKFLSAQFSMKDLGTTDVILGIKIIYFEEGIGLS